MNRSERAAPRPANVAAILREVEAIQTDRRIRTARGVFFIEGVRNFVQAIDNGFVFDRIIFSERLLTAPLARKLVRRCRRCGVACTNLSPEQFRTVSLSRRASGVAAIVKQRWLNLEDIPPDKGLCWVLLETVRSHGNLGTLIRSSNAVDGAGFVFVGKNIDPYAPAVIRSAMGALFQQTFVRTEWYDLQRWINHRKRVVIGAAPDGASDFHHFDFPRAPVLFLGEERKGLTPRQRDLCHHLVQIPMASGVDSLNLSVAGSLFLYEIYRARASGFSKSSRSADA